MVMRFSVRRMQVAAIGSAVLALSACSSSSDSNEPSDAEAPPATSAASAAASSSAAPSTSATEGSVKDPTAGVARYPGGLTITLTKVEKIAAGRCYNPDTGGNEPQAGKTCVLVQATAKNGGAAPIAITGENDGTPDLEMLSGPDQYEIDSGNFMGDKGIPDIPRRLTAGSTCVIGSVFAVPDAQLGTLAVTVSVPIDGTDDFTFTDVESLLK